FIDTRNVDGIWCTADRVLSGISELTKLYHIDDLYIEEDLKKFKRGASSASTITTLAKINGIVSYNARCIMSTEPQHISAAIARSWCGVKIVKPKTVAQRR